MATLAAHVIRLIHTGFYADGRQNVSSIYVNDLDEGRDPQTGQTRKVQVYVPANSFVDIPFSTRSLLSLAGGATKGFIETGQLTAIFLMCFRKIGDVGGTTGLGAPLTATVDNAERAAGVTRFVLPIAEAVGFLEGERFTVEGLTGAFDDLNGTFLITAIAPEEDLAGVNTATYTISAASLGPAVASGIAAGATLTLPDYKITVCFTSEGDIGGAGGDFYGYVNGQFLPIDLSTFGTTLRIEDEGTLVDAAAATLNFVGAGVVASSSGPGVVDVTIPGPPVGPVVVVYTADDAITSGDLVVVTSTGGVVPAISSIASGNWNVLGVAQNSAILGGSVSVMQDDGVDTLMRFVSPPPAAANGDPVFLSTSAGRASTSPPSPPGTNTFVLVGILKGADGATGTPNVVFRQQIVVQKI